MTIQKFEVPDWIRSVLICDPTDIWGNVVGMGLAELAATLSFTKRHDRRGNVYHVDGFEHGLSGCDTDLSGSGASVSLTSSETRSGSFAAKLTGGSTLTRYATVWYKLPLPPLCKIGVEVTFRLDSNVEYVLLFISYIDGTTEHQGYVRHDTANHKWQYVNSSGVWTDFLTGKQLLEIDYMFHLFKLVIDPNSNKYVRALVSGQEVDMSSYGLYTPTSSVMPHLWVEFFAYSEAGVNGVVILDNIIITINEPS